MADYIWVSLPCSAHDGPVTQRGWCFQESILSSRALVFGEEQLHFQCQELRVREDGGGQRALPFQIQNAVAKYSLYWAGAGGYPVSTKSPPLDGTILHEYTKRELTEASDVFAALSGLAQIVEAKVRSRYLEGLWEGDIVRGLLWQTWYTKLLRPVS
ncbi:hypothetical protein F4782DRAFT_534665 [Xylaria castorea]|nr:hypothetical protein F4782DRAFT_534665 [Xylaria castorea]